MGKVRTYLKGDIKRACATKWVEGYYSWELFDVQPLSYNEPVKALLGIYELNLNIKREQNAKPD